MVCVFFFIFLFGLDEILAGVKSNFSEAKFRKYFLLLYSPSAVHFCTLLSLDVYLGMDITWSDFPF